ncbi:S8 family serine peptidase [Gemmatimonadota bacterium]
MKARVSFFAILVALIVIGCTNRSIAIKLWQITGDLIGNNYHISKADSLPEDLAALGLEELGLLRFDTRTKWPGLDGVNPEFHPEKWIETCKNPGLGIKKLHEQGVTGRGVAIAVIDKPINPGHRELVGRIIYHEVITDSATAFSYRYHSHGAGCASILCGTDCGVAPEAKLYYRAVPDDARDMYNYPMAVREIISLNRQLPTNGRIRAISISHCVASIRNEEQMAAWAAVVQEAEQEGIAVIYSDINRIHPFFVWGGCPPWLDKDNPENYLYPEDAIKSFLWKEGKILLPAYYRSVASNRGTGEYAFYGRAGFSWSIPYLTGLAALAWGVDADLTFSEIVDLLKETSRTTGSGVRIVDPRQFILAVQSRKKELALH